VARIFLERREMDDELRRLFEQLIGKEAPAHPAECKVALDILETRERLEIVVDLVGVEPESVQIVIVRDTVLISGHKRAPSCQPHEQAMFHIAERTFGRFGRAVRLTGAFDAGRGEATLRAGELRLRLPRIEDRRGREHRIPVRAE
jgi:HSP20 family protein